MNDEYLKTLGEMGVAFIVVGEYLDLPNVPSICCDDPGGIGLAVRHLVDSGHRRIGWVGGPPGMGSAVRRESAFVDRIKEAGLEIQGQLFQPGDYTVAQGRAAGLRLLVGGRRPTAIVAANDLSAIGVIEAAHELGLRVPADVAVTGFDDLSTSSYECGVSLTTIHQSISQIGAMGAKRLLDAIETGNLPQGHVDVEVTLVVRESTGDTRSTR